MPESSPGASDGTKLSRLAAVAQVERADRVRGDVGPVEEGRVDAAMRLEAVGADARQAV